MHRHQWTDVCPLQPRPPLPEPAGPLHQLHLRGWQPRADVAAEQDPGPVVPAVHPGGDGVRAHLARGRQAHRFTPPTNHQRQNPLQAQC